MKLSYNMTGAKRKSLAGAISQILNAPTKYLGASTFSYEIGDYRIDKSGTVTGPDNPDLEDALHQQGFDAAEREYDEPATYESGLGGMGALDEIPDIDQHHPGRYADPKLPFTPEMQKQIDDYFLSLPMTEEEELGLGRTRREDIQGENGMRADDVPEPERLSIEVPMTGFSPEKLGNLIKMVNAKAPLLKAALETDELPIQQVDKDGGKLCFPWFDPNSDADHVKAYATLIAKLCETAKGKKRVTAKENDMTGSPKYAMRCFLLSLGFIGDEYKSARKILLSKMSGSSSRKEAANDDVSEQRKSRTASQDLP